MRFTIGVVGPGAGASEQDCRNAHRIGSLLASEGHVVVNGGLNGVMESVSQGAAEAGGLVVGLLPTEDPSAANPYLTVALPTGLGEMRNALLIRVSDAIIGVGCSWGTLSELTLAVRTGVPLVVLDPWQVGAAWPAVASGPDDAVVQALRLAAHRRR